MDLLQEGFMRLGHLNYTTPMDVRPFVNTTIAERAKARLEGRQ